MPLLAAPPAQNELDPVARLPWDSDGWILLAVTEIRKGGSKDLGVPHWNDPVGDFRGGQTPPSLSEIG